MFFSNNQNLKINELPTVELTKIKHLINPRSTSEIYTLRSIEKYIWRFKNPHHQYNALTYSSNNGEITSFVIYYVDQQTVQLIDYSFNSNFEGKKLLNHLIHKEKKSQPIKGVLAFCQENGPWSQTLRKIGFISNPFSKGPLSYKTPFIIFTDHKEFDKINNSKNWNISPFDHDSL